MKLSSIIISGNQIKHFIKVYIYIYFITTLMTYGTHEIIKKIVKHVKLRENNSKNLKHHKILNILNSTK